MQKMEFCVPYIRQTNKVRHMKQIALHTACNEEDALKLLVDYGYAVTNEKKATNYVK